MEFRQLSYFIALCEERSVTKAARRLNVVQPAISMQISKLEEELGQALFQRMPKGMLPTPAGEEAYRLLAPILQDLRGARDRIANFGGRVAGHISVGVIASVTNSALSECLEVFCERYPAVSIRVTGGYTTDFLEMLQIGQLDIAMVNRSRGKVGLPAIPMMREDFVMISAPGTMIADREGISLKTAATMRLIIPSTRHGLRTILDEAAHDIGVRLEPALELDELKTIEELVQRTDFVTILPPAAVDRSLRNGLLKSTPIVPSVTRDIVCVHNPKRALSPAAELFIAELRAKMSTVIIPSEPTHRYP